jgi:hypothetical protein
MPGNIPRQRFHFNGNLKSFHTHVGADQRQLDTWSTLKNKTKQNLIVGFLI